MSSVRFCHDRRRFSDFFVAQTALSTIQLPAVEHGGMRRRGLSRKMNRREFVAMTGVAALAPDCVIGGSKPKRMRLGFQVYGVRDMCAKNFASTLNAVRMLGYEGVETGRFYGRNAKELGALMRDVGLELFSLQLYPHALVEPKLAETIKFCHECSCHRIDTAWFKGSTENENDWQLVVGVINHAADVCAKEGIEIGYHNHDQEFRIRFSGKTACEWLFERFSPMVMQEFDPGWCVIVGEDPLKWLERHPHRNPTVHVMPAFEVDKLGCREVEKPRPGECGVGSKWDKADWKKIIPSLKSDGTEWLVVKPTAFPGSLDDLKASHDYLKGIV